MGYLSSVLCETRPFLSERSGQVPFEQTGRLKSESCLSHAASDAFFFTHNGRTRAKRECYNLRRSAGH